METKWVVGTAVAAALLASGGEPEPVLVVAGALVNALLGKAAKRALSQPRPPGATQTDHGMPSSHAMSLFFFGSTLAVGCLRAALLGSLLQSPHASHDAPPAWGVAVGCLLWVLAAVLCLAGAAVLSWSEFPVPADASLSLSSGSASSASGQSLNKKHGTRSSIQSTRAHVTQPTSCRIHTFSRP